MLTQKLSPRALAIAAFLAAIAWAASPVAAFNPEADPHADPHAAPAKAPEPKPAPAAKTPGAMPSEVGHASTPAAKPTTPKPTAKPKIAAADEALPDVPRTAEDALKTLAEGNERWVTGNTLNPNTGILRRKTTAENGQQPFAVVLSCADSRAPIERVFDRGVGEIFTIRIAGNVSGPHEAASIEYAVDHIGVPLLVVMGHTKCGAVRAAVDYTPGSHITLNIDALVAAIRPSVDRARKMNPQSDPDSLALAAVRENVWQSIFDLYKSSPQMMDMVRSGKVKVVGAVLDVSTGKVDWMGEHPWQDAIISAFTPPAPAAAPAPTKTATAEPATTEAH